MFAWPATAARMRGWADFGRREANSKGGRSRLTVALVGAAGHGKAGAAGSRASIRLFLLRPRVACDIDHILIDP